MTGLDHLYAVVLAGGEGNRFWPLSRRTAPKQFLRIAGRRTLLQQTIGRVAPPLPPERVLIVTNRAYQDDVRWQLRESLRRADAVHLLLEPSARNTAPALAMAAFRLLQIDPEAVMLVLPSDHAISPVSALWRTIRRALPLAASGALVTFGIVPAEPTSAYGYIQRGAAVQGRGYRIARFIEKPPLPAARRLIKQGGCYWNSGLFLWRAAALLEELCRHAPRFAAPLAVMKRAHGTAREAAVIERSFGRMPELSIDYAVMERTARAVVVPADFRWSDLGSLTALSELAPKDRSENVTVGDVISLDTADSILYGGRRLLAAIGLRDMVVVDTPDALLVCPKARAQEVKQIVGELKRRNSSHYHLPHAETRPWGSFAVLEEGPSFKVKRLVINPHARLSLQMHHHRSEHWVVVAGRARIRHGHRTYDLHANESTYIPKGTKHRIENRTQRPLEIIEVQSGSYVGEDDIVRFSDDYKREG
ncbi:MAG: mannose-1-phosphate guanylyltransferase/mannose-6-phosphate isomerase [Nitrospirae bacterium]|nr:mannose-1-phosphate guanylyltransferase/mannose-6-phosphate isomerase [Nitrospirota bacterium]